ncbi:hypothetical protein ACA910_015714 [Epithemia clementina (nom. ined.)]
MFLSSLPGGPPPTATCIRGGWTMGHMKDFYMSQVIRHQPTLLFFVENPEAVKTTMPWLDSEHHFSGIPPQVAALHDLMVVRDEHCLLVDQFMDKIKALLDEQGIQYGGVLLVQNLREILGKGLNNICSWLEEMEVGHCRRQEGGVQHQVQAEDLEQRVGF